MDYYFHSFIFSSFTITYEDKQVLVSATITPNLIFLSQIYKFCIRNHTNNGEEK